MTTFKTRARTVDMLGPTTDRRHSDRDQRAVQERARRLCRPRRDRLLPLGRSVRPAGRRSRDDPRRLRGAVAHDRHRKQVRPRSTAARPAQAAASDAGRKGDRKAGDRDHRPAGSGSHAREDRRRRIRPYRGVPELEHIRVARRRPRGHRNPSAVIRGRFAAFGPGRGRNGRRVPLGRREGRTRRRAAIAGGARRGTGAIRYRSSAYRRLPRRAVARRERQRDALRHQACIAVAGGRYRRGSGSRPSGRAEEGNPVEEGAARIQQHDDPGDTDADTHRVPRSQDGRVGRRADCGGGVLHSRRVRERRSPDQRRLRRVRSVPGRGIDLRRYENGARYPLERRARSPRALRSVLNRLRGVRRRKQALDDPARRTWETGEQDRAVGRVVHLPKRHPGPSLRRHGVRLAGHRVQADKERVLLLFLASQDVRSGVARRGEERQPARKGGAGGVSGEQGLSSIPVDSSELLPPDGGGLLPRGRRARGGIRSAKGGTLQRGRSQEAARTAGLEEKESVRGKSERVLRQAQEERTAGKSPGVDGTPCNGAAERYRHIGQSTRSSRSPGSRTQRTRGDRGSGSPVPRFAPASGAQQGRASRLGSVQRGVRRAPGQCVQTDAPHDRRPDRRRGAKGRAVARSAYQNGSGAGRPSGGKLERRQTGRVGK